MEVVATKKKVEEERTCTYHGNERAGSDAQPRNPEECIEGGKRGVPSKISQRDEL